MTQTTDVTLGRNNCLATLNMQSCRILNGIVHLQVLLHRGLPWTFSTSLPYIFGSSGPEKFVTVSVSSGHG